MTFSLASLKPKIVDVKINLEYGEPLVIPIVPLTYTEYHNASLGLTAPEAPKEPRLINGKKEDVVNTQDADYQRAWSEYIDVLQFRRLAIALSKAGAEDLQGKTLDEQVEILQAMDRGVMRALIRFLEGEANHKLATRFQSVSEDGSADMQGDGLDAE